MLLLLQRSSALHLLHSKIITDVILSNSKATFQFLPFQMSLEHKTLLMTYCFLKLNFLCLHCSVLLFVCFPPFLRLAHFFLFNALPLICLSPKQWHCPQCPLWPTACSVYICAGRCNFVLAFASSASNYFSWMLAILINSGYNPTHRYWAVTYGSDSSAKTTHFCWLFCPHWLLNISAFPDSPVISNLSTHTSAPGDLIRGRSLMLQNSHLSGRFPGSPR